MEIGPYDFEFALRLVISFFVGMAIGGEREYHTKAAGLRTIIMICLGSTIFTEMSMLIDPNSTDRIASTIVTGVGFLGAGVIFKDGLTVSGLTTASTIWIAAALGMAIGMGEYIVTGVALVIVLLSLTFLEQVTFHIERLHQVRNYKIGIVPEPLVTEELDGYLKKSTIKHRRVRDLKNEDSNLLAYDISGRWEHLEEFNAFLKNNPKVLWYEY